MRLIDFFDRGVSIDPDRAFLVEDGRVTTYADAQRRSLAIAERLKQAGALPGSRIAVLSHNSAFAFEAILGVVRSGSAWVSLNARSTVDERAGFMANCAVDTLVYAADFGGEVERIGRSCSQLRRTIALDDLCRPGAGEAETDRSLAILEDRERPDPDRISMIAASGGTTGPSKGVMISDRNWVVGMAAAQIYWDDHPVYLLAAPMTHAGGGLVFALSQMGATNIILKEFDPAKVLRLIQEQSVTHLFLPPTAIYALLDHPDIGTYDYSSLKYFVYAASPISEERLRQAIGVFGPVMAQFYGQTECFMCISFFSQEQHVAAMADERLRHRLVSCGRPSRFVRVAIAGDDGAFLPTGQRGEIVIQSGLEFVGYVNALEETAHVKRDGWHHTGDIGYLDEDNYLYIVDRARDMIISGGFNIFPSEVERIVETHPNVRECIVIGTPDAKWGEAVTAVVVLDDRADWNEADFIAWCRKRMSGMNTPKVVHVVDSLPKTPTGKVLKREVRKAFWEGQGRNV